MENLKLQDLDVKLGFFTNVLGTLSKLPKLSQTGQVAELETNFFTIYSSSQVYM